jgi:DNA topoisomerase I
MDGNLLFEVEDELRTALAGLKPEDAAVLALLRSRLAKEVDRVAASSKSATSAGEPAQAA